MVKKKKPFRLRNNSNTIAVTPAEAEIMRVVWDIGEPVTVRDVYEALRERRRIAYTTVMSVMNKLAGKGVLNQDKSAVAYVYSAAVTDVEVASSMLDSVVDTILAGASEPMISRLLGSRKSLTPEQLERLEKLLKKND